MCNVLLLQYGAQPRDDDDDDQLSSWVYESLLALDDGNVRRGLPANILQGMEKAAYSGPSVPCTICLEVIG